MTTLVKQTKVAGLFAAVAVLAVLTTGCSKKISKEAAPSASATEAANLTQQASDLFTQPIQPNPLALSPEEVVVTVDGEKITHGEIMQGVQMNMMQMSRRVSPQQLSQMTGQVYQNVKDTLIATIL
ncbi:MAG: hypothetical protein IT583_00540, partial [Verrucomicrobia bacterium]|nr:hypothetical protein [Verrucomicrobiota bacterium]